MILDLEELPPVLLAPPPEGVTNAPVRDDSGIADFLALEPAIWERSRTTPEFLLASINDPSGPDLAFVAYSKQRPIGFGRVTTSLESPFYGSLGRKRSPGFSRRGVYRAQSNQTLIPSCSS
jgi:hypothetical protein